MAIPLSTAGNDGALADDLAEKEDQPENASADNHELYRLDGRTQITIVELHILSSSNFEQIESMQDLRRVHAVVTVKSGGTNRRIC
ncbi:MAG: hypothetical protein Q8K78_07820 [Planctomycetaceae bacterium]|nr:hypothetical protein [Planctomycetaceae bacterium]